MEDDQINQKNNEVGTCTRCNKERKIYCKNKCKSCYNFEHRDNEKYKESLKRWREKNPNYFKEYYSFNKNE